MRLDVQAVKRSILESVSKTRGRIILCLVFAGAVLLTSGSARADCKAQLTASGIAPALTKPTAELQARTAWQANAKYNYGMPYAQWSKAQNKKPATFQTSTQGLIKKQYIATYSAKPCN
ncbi:MAG: hypothetical protein Q8M26_16290 [Pseudolabrys sp.]|nr:hypothetical protein [Pseudolabrys sp.]